MPSSSRLSGLVCDAFEIAAFGDQAHLNLKLAHDSYRHILALSCPADRVYDQGQLKGTDLRGQTEQQTQRTQQGREWLTCLQQTQRRSQIRTCRGNSSILRAPQRLG